MKKRRRKESRKEGRKVGKKEGRKEGRKKRGREEDYICVYVWSCGICFVPWKHWRVRERAHLCIPDVGILFLKNQSTCNISLRWRKIFRKFHFLISYAKCSCSSVSQKVMIIFLGLKPEFWIMYESICSFICFFSMSFLQDVSMARINGCCGVDGHGFKTEIML